MGQNPVHGDGFQKYPRSDSELEGNGLTKEYILERLFRDARPTLIEDGNNETLARHGGHILGETYPRKTESF